MSDLTQQKARLRKELRARRKAITEKKEKSRILQQHLQGADCFLSADRLFCYLPLADEAETFLLMEEAFAMGKRVAAPRCLADGEMMFFEITDLSQLNVGSYGILEPDCREENILLPTLQSLILVPGMAFDWDGYRLGYGKGYYDRYLAKHPAKTVGLCFYDCMTGSLPRGEYDLPVEFLATERGITAVSTNMKGDEKDVGK